MSFRNVNPAKVATVKHINNLITCLVNIKDETGEFLMPLADGRIIDTKGWEDWEVSIACIYTGSKRDAHRGADLTVDSRSR